MDVLLDLVRLAIWCMLLSLLAAIIRLRGPPKER
jgi:hypothetical protein